MGDEKARQRRQRTVADGIEGEPDEPQRPPAFASAFRREVETASSHVTFLIPALTVSQLVLINAYRRYGSRGPLSRHKRPARNARRRVLAIDVWESAVQPQGRFGAVFERDDETAYLYLLDLDRPEGHQIIGRYWLGAVVTMPPDVSVRVAWTPEGDMVGVLVEGQLLAVFDMANAQANRCKGREAEPDERQRFLDA
jgi:hypothetical protein